MELAYWSVCLSSSKGGDVVKGMEGMVGGYLATSFTLLENMKIW